MRLELDDIREEAPNLTPLIDVVFLLLVFFLVATTFADQEVEMDLELPQAAHGDEPGDDDLLVIHVQADGTLRLDGREITLAGLQQALRTVAERAGQDGREVLIRGDTHVQLGRVVEAFDACLGASLTRVSIAAEPAGGARSGD
ncbi:MAG: biopolymer transporter ExbD [Planctomycetes bacterium]|nr:biopolymer transporter ExbD [Planctomycetota bacterium]